MTPGALHVFSAPVKKRILMSVKCSRNVRNGILCDACDLWHHFRCANIKEDEIPDEKSQWKCPRCLNSDAAGTVGQVSLVHDVQSLSAIIDALKEQNLHLIDEVKNLKERSVEMDYKLCKNVLRKTKR